MKQVNTWIEDRPEGSRRTPHGATRGQTLVMFAVTLGGLLALMGLVFDGGRLYYEHSRMQRAADAGAIAANWEQQRRNLDLVDAAGKHATKLNGFEHGVDNVTVQVNPDGNNREVEVIITQSYPTTFLRVVGRNTANVSARAVAALTAFADGCVLALEDTPGVQALQSKGGGQISANCGVISNSDARTTGGGVIKATYNGIAGDWDGVGFDPTPVQIPPVLDPLGHIPEPTGAGWATGTVNNSTNTIECPGGTCVFNSQIKITTGDWTFQSGLYYLNKGMSVTGGNITGLEVMFYNPNVSGKDHIELGGNGRIILTPPSSGTYEGILFFGSRSALPKSPGNKLGRGNEQSSITGIMYFPNEHVDWAGTSEANGPWTMLISKTIDVTGTASVDNTQFTLPTDPNDLPDVTRPMLQE